MKFKDIVGFMTIRVSLFQSGSDWVAVAYDDDLRLVANTLPCKDQLQCKNSLLESLHIRRVRDYVDSPPDPSIVEGVTSALSTGRHHPELSFEGIPEFYREVFTVAIMIPRGRVTTYGSIAKAIGRPRAQRAVGNAMASNPFPFIVPCHRVIKSDLSLGGYSGKSGSHIKESLLRKEGVVIQNGKVMEKYLLAPDTLSCRS